LLDQGRDLTWRPRTDASRPSVLSVTATSSQQLEGNSATRDAQFPEAKVLFGPPTGQSGGQCLRPKKMIREALGSFADIEDMRDQTTPIRRLRRVSVQLQAAWGRPATPTEPTDSWCGTPEPTCASSSLNGEGR